MSTIQDLQRVNLQKMAARESQSASHMTDNMTDNMTGQESDKLTDRLTSLSVSLPTDQPSDPPAAKSVIHAIRQAARGLPEKPVYKTVTLKMRPDLDAQVEAHCRQTGRLKQDVIHDALTLYFSVLEGGEDE
jgi:hypothetical protein